MEQFREASQGSDLTGPNRGLVAPQPKGTQSGSSGSSKVLLVTVADVQASLGP